MAEPRTQQSTSTLFRNRNSSMKNKLIAALCGGAVLGSGLIGAAPAAVADDGSVSYLAPAYQRGELTGDGKIDIDEIAILMAALGVTDTDPDWNLIAPADLDADGVITLVDVSMVSQQFIYDDGEFELVDADLVDIQAAMTAGTLTSAELTAEYLARIAGYDRSTDVDPRTPAEMLESIISTNPDAMAQATALDAERAATGPRGMLHGVPIIVKDNINTIGMATTTGCMCLGDNYTSTDAESVERLRAAGAVVIAKANLSEFANSTVSSISAYGTVRNAYAFETSPGGSSGGTGAAISGNLAAFGLGTDTGGSVRVPSSFNGLVGLRPTMGLVSREGVIPLDLYRDTVGPMARSVSDVALALDAMAGTDPLDTTTVAADGAKPVSYAASLDMGALSGKRIGYVSGFMSTADTTGSSLLPGLRADLAAAGATVVDVGGFGTVNGYSVGNLAGSSSFTHDMDEYLDTYYQPGYTFMDLANKVAASEAAYAAGTVARDDSSWPSATIRGWASTTEAQRAAAYPTFASNQVGVRNRIDSIMTANNLDAIIYPSTSGVTASAGSSNRISAYSGYPAVSVPMGSNAAGLPMGIEFLAQPYSEAKLLSFAYAYEQVSQNRTPTTLFPRLTALG